MNDIKRKYNPIVNLSKITSNKKNLIRLQSKLCHLFIYFNVKIPVALSNLPTTQLARPVFSPFKLTPFQLNPFLTATQMIGRLVYTRKKEDCYLALTLLLGLLADSTDCLPCLTTLTKLKAERFLLFGRESLSNGFRW